MTKAIEKFTEAVYCLFGEHLLIQSGEKLFKFTAAF